MSTYGNLTNSLEDAIELHQATMSLGVAISAVTGAIEIGLRNAIFHEAGTDFARENWLTDPPDGVSWAPLEVLAIKKAIANARRSAYSKLSGSEKAKLDAVAFPRGLPPSIKHRKLAQHRQGTIQVSEGQIVAQLTLHFWKRLFSDHYERTLWKRSLKRIFPNKTYQRAHVAAPLETIYEVRNRLAHHEPVFGKRLEASLEAIDFILENMGSVTPSPEAPLAKLIMPQREILVGQVAMFRSAWARLAKEA